MGHCCALFINTPHSYINMPRFINLSVYIYLYPYLWLFLVAAGMPPSTTCIRSILAAAAIIGAVPDLDSLLVMIFLFILSSFFCYNYYHHHLIWPGQSAGRRWRRKCCWRGPRGSLGYIVKIILFICIYKYYKQRFTRELGCMILYTYIYIYVYVCVCVCVCTS
jgi:hypothetical protein